jgi:hypothetical protein
MGLFYTARQPAIPTIKGAIEDALRVDPGQVPDTNREAAARTLEVAKQTQAEFNAPRFIAAIVIGAVLLGAAIWTAKQGLDDISKNLMTAFNGYSGIVIGLLGGEAQKTAT